MTRRYYTSPVCETIVLRSARLICDSERLDSNGAGTGNAQNMAASRGARFDDDEE